MRGARSRATSVAQARMRRRPARMQAEDAAVAPDLRGAYSALLRRGCNQEGSPRSCRARTRNANVPVASGQWGRAQGSGGGARSAMHEGATPLAAPHHLQLVGSVTPDTSARVSGRHSPRSSFVLGKLLERNEELSLRPRRAGSCPGGYGASLRWNKARARDAG